MKILDSVIQNTVPGEPCRVSGELLRDDPANIRLEDNERQACEIWTRVMGYHRPVASFNPGKQSEYAERKFFKSPVD